MTGRGCGKRGKMPMTKGRARVLQPGKLPVKIDRRRRKIQASPQLVQVITPPIQAIPQLIKTSTDEAFTFDPTLGHIPSHEVEHGSSSYYITHEPQIPESMSQQPLQEEEEQHQQEDEKEEHEPAHQKHERDADRNVIIRPVGQEFTPKNVVVDAIKSAIQTQFRGSYHCWSETPVYVRDRWWQLFQDKVSWDPCYHELVYNAFKKRCANYLIHMLRKARKKGVKPDWMDEQAWADLLAHWESTNFQRVSTKNKTNCAPATVYIMESHLIAALEMAKKHVLDVPLDKRYLSAHKRHAKSVDFPSKRTYVDEDTRSETQEADEVTWLQSSQEYSMEKSRDWSYNPTDLSSDLQCGVSSSTVESKAPSHIVWSELNEAIALHEETTAAYKTAREVLERGKKAQQRLNQLHEQMLNMMEQLNQRMTSRKRRSRGGASSCASPPSP